MINMPQYRAWLPFGDGPADARARMFCLPFAGGGASNFAAWRKLLPQVGVAPLQYPGHETRIDEAPLQSMDRMIEGLADVIAPRLDRPYLLFGYSMGAKLAFALIKRLAARGLPQPARLIVAAHRPPDRASNAVTAIGLPDREFKQVLRAYGGMPDELFDDEEFCAMALPVMRADFALAAQPVDLTPVDCPIIAYAGTDDVAATAADMAEWRRFTTSGFQLREFAGGHFFLRGAAGFESALKADMAAALLPHYERLVSA
jgi:medium-chain acyl-[acyl-carrier-protein] hydrolase